jgi:1-deoxy-D-xylulose-5-phosphate reductoisomerase
MMNKVFEIIEAKKIFDLQYDDLKILIHSKSYVHALVKFKNGITKILIHDTNMRIPIFNSLYENAPKIIKSKNLDINLLNNLDLKNVNIKRFPVVKILRELPRNESLFETVIVSANDQLVKMFLNNKIKFTDISKILLKIVKSNEFMKYKEIIPKNIADIKELSNYVSLKINSLDI